MNSLPDMTIPPGQKVNITATGKVIIQAKGGAVFVANTTSEVGDGFQIRQGAYHTFTMEPDGISVSNPATFPVIIAVIQL